MASLKEHQLRPAVRQVGERDAAQRPDEAEGAQSRLMGLETGDQIGPGNAWGLLVGGTPAGGAAGAVSGLRHVWRAQGHRWIAAATDGTIWWIGIGP